MKKIGLALMLILWLATILTIFFVVQKPDFLNIKAGLKDLLLNIFIPLLLASLATCIGFHLLPNPTPSERLTLGTALGMGFFGLIGFGLAMAGWAKPVVLWMILLILTSYFIFTGKLRLAWQDVKHSIQELSASMKNIPLWIPISLGVAITLAFFMSLAPPVEDFDALLYHLTVPAWWLRDGGMTLAAVSPYWYPQIIEGSFVWPMAMGFDTATHLIHLLWFILTISLLWMWMRQLWDNSTVWNALLILLTMPSLLWLASWAYTDYALTFTGLATLYALWKWQATQNIRWLYIGGIMAGMVVSIKYTGFFVPMVGILLIIVWGQGIYQRLINLILFSGTTVLVASPWYLRNWIWMKNPIYPFLFGGRYWDSFLNQAHSAAGTGIGLDIRQLLLLPLTTTLGTQDTNFFDGRIGPFLLILSPLAIIAFWQARHEPSGSRRALLSIGLFSFIGIAAWTLGVISSANLFQARYLFPALIPLVILLAVGMNSLNKLDTSQLRVSFIVRSMLAFTVIVNLLNFSLQVVVRNPLSVAIGITSRKAYIEKQQPGYAHALALLKNVPENAKVYLLFEPRSYGMNIQVQPDIINTNFSHDLWLYKTPENMIAAWKRQGYTHILLSKSGADFIFQNGNFSSSNEEAALKQVEILLDLMDESQSGDYILYRIP